MVLEDWRDGGAIRPDAGLGMGTTGIPAPDGRAAGAGIPAPEGLLGFGCAAGIPAADGRPVGAGIGMPVADDLAEGVAAGIFVPEGRATDDFTGTLMRAEPRACLRI